MFTSLNPIHVVYVLLFILALWLNAKGYTDILMAPDLRL